MNFLSPIKDGKKSIFDSCKKTRDLFCDQVPKMKLRNREKLEKIKNKISNF